jgi:tRNA pseudouridine38-40 synthase
VLPPEVRLIDVHAVAPAFHARYSAQSKTYRYWIVNGPLATPFEWRYAWHVPERLDMERMFAAASLFEGEHDFAAFRATGGSVKTSVRRVHRSSVAVVAPGTKPADWAFPIDRADVRRLVYEIAANGFLRHMVRAIVGTLVEIGTGRRELAAIETALASGNRADAGATAPACGLCLVSVDYPEGA